MLNFCFCMRFTCILCKIMAKRFFEDFNHAVLYAKFRPIPPVTIAEKLVKYLGDRYTGTMEHAVDVGCGSGQSTTILAPFFNKVTGMDVSDGQLKQAQNSPLKPSNVSYRLNGAENLPFPDSSVQLITSCQAAHWFDLPSFFKEADRVLVKNGVLALYGYTFPVPIYKDKSVELKKIMDDVYHIDTGKYWSSDRFFVDERYIDPKFTIPYPSFARDEDHYTEKEISALDLQGYISTWSGFQNLRKKEGDEAAKKILDNFLERTMEVMEVSSPKDSYLSIRTSFFLLYGYKEG